MVEQVHIVSASPAAHPPDWATNSALKALISQVASLRSLFSSSISQQRSTSDSQAVRDNEILAALRRGDDSRSGDALRSIEEEISSRRHRHSLHQDAQSGDDRRAQSVVSEIGRTHQASKSHTSFENDKLRGALIGGAASMKSIAGKAIDANINYGKWAMFNTVELLRQGYNASKAVYTQLDGTSGQIRYGINAIAALAVDLKSNKDDVLEMFMRHGHGITDVVGGLEGFRNSTIRLNKQFIGMGDTLAQTGERLAEFYSEHRQRGTLHLYTQERQAEQHFAEQQLWFRSLSQAFGMSLKQLKEMVAKTPEEQAITTEVLKMKLRNRGLNEQQIMVGVSQWDRLNATFGAVGGAGTNFLQDMLYRGEASDAYASLSRYSKDFADEMLVMLKSLGTEGLELDKSIQSLNKHAQIAMDIHATEAKLRGEGSTTEMELLTLWSARTQKLNKTIEYLAEEAKLRAELAADTAELYEGYQDIKNFFTKLGLVFLGDDGILRMFAKLMVKVETAVGSLFNHIKDGIDNLLGSIQFWGVDYEKNANGEVTAELISKKNEEIFAKVTAFIGTTIGGVVKGIITGLITAFLGWWAYKKILKGGKGKDGPDGPDKLRGGGIIGLLKTLTFFAGTIAVAYAVVKLMPEYAEALKKFEGISLSTVGVASAAIGALAVMIGGPLLLISKFMEKINPLALAKASLALIAFAGVAGTTIGVLLGTFAGATSFIGGAGMKFLDYVLEDLLPTFTEAIPAFNAFKELFISDNKTEIISSIKDYAQAFIELARALKAVEWNELKKLSSMVNVSNMASQPIQLITGPVTYQSPMDAGRINSFVRKPVEDSGLEDGEVTANSPVVSSDSPISSFNVAFVQRKVTNMEEYLNSIDISLKQLVENNRDSGTRSLPISPGSRVVSGGTTQGGTRR